MPIRFHADMVCFPRFSPLVELNLGWGFVFQLLHTFYQQHINIYKIWLKRLNLIVLPTLEVVDFIELLFFAFYVLLWLLLS